MLPETHPLRVLMRLQERATKAQVSVHEQMVQDLMKAHPGFQRRHFASVSMRFTPQRLGGLAGFKGVTPFREKWPAFVPDLFQLKGSLLTLLEVEHTCPLVLRAEHPKMRRMVAFRREALAHGTEVKLYRVRVPSPVWLEVSLQDFEEAQ